jgi:hypothetical protein
LEQQQKYYEEHHKFLMHQQTYKPTTQALVQPRHVPPAKFERKTYSKSPVKDKILREPVYVQEPYEAPQTNVYSVPVTQAPPAEPVYYRPQPPAPVVYEQPVYDIPKPQLSPRKSNLSSHSKQQPPPAEPWNSKHTKPEYNAEEEESKYHKSERRKAYDNQLKERNARMAQQFETDKTKSDSPSRVNGAQSKK